MKAPDFILSMLAGKKIRKGYPASTQITLLGILTWCRGMEEAAERRRSEGQSVPALRRQSQSRAENENASRRDYSKAHSISDLIEEAVSCSS